MTKLTGGNMPPRFIRGKQVGDAAQDADGLLGGGEMARRIWAFDWGNHPLGPREEWPQSLKIVIRIMLTSRYAMWLGWGPELHFFCNDAYLPTLGIKESWALGAPAREVWKEIWGDIGLRANWVMETGEATWDESLLLFLERSGMREETYHTFSYSPVTDDAGAIGGILCVVTEETEQVIGTRRMHLMRELGADLAATRTEEDICAAIIRQFEAQPKDLPFALVYRFEPDGRHAVLTCIHGAAAGAAVAPPRIELASPSAVWPARELLDRRVPVLVDDLGLRFAHVPSGVRGQPAREALVVPLARQGQERAAGFLVAGINPFRPLDSSYRGFIDLLAAQIAAALAAARAYEAERRRAEAMGELNRVRTDFFNNVSHEFRTPLTLMLGPLEDELQQNPSASPRVRTAYRHSVRLLKLVNTLLDLSRLEAGRMQGLYRPVDLATVTAGHASLFRSTIEDAGLSLTVDCPPLPEAIHVDPEMWENILLNLLSNALKFTFKGGIHVALRWAPPMVELEVSDTGVGIPPADLPRVFARFHRVRGTRSRTLDGTGIGLALVRELARLHGGEATAESTEGRGTTVTVRVRSGTTHLPPERLVAKTETDVPSRRGDPDLWLSLDEAPGSTASAPPFARPGISGGRILIADDHADMRHYLRGLLEERYEVETVGDGAEALAAARLRRPDLLITDGRMPEVDGLALLRALREDEGLRTVPVLLLSADGGEAARLEGLDAGADDYLLKPFSTRELLVRVRSMVALVQFRAEAGERESDLRALAEEREQQARFQAMVLEQVNDAVVAIDLDHCVTYVNAAAERQYQRPNEEAVGRPLRDFFDYRWLRPEDEVRAYRAMDAGEDWRGENLHVIRDGSVLLVESVMSPLRDDQDRVTGWLAVIRDITQRRQAERALRESEERLRLATQAGKLGVWDWDLVDDTLTWTDSVYSIHGLDAASFIPSMERFWKLVHPDDRAAVEFAVQRALKGEASYEIDFRVLRPDGGTAWVLNSARVVREGGRPVRMLGVEIDLSERKRIELALRESEERFRTLASHAPVGIILTDHRGSCVYVNERWCEMSGLSPEQAQGRGWISAVHPEDRERFAAGMGSIRRAEVPPLVEFRFLRPDGTVTWLQGSAVPFRAPEEEAEGYIGTLMDITERKQAELEVHRARDEALAASRAKDEFLAALSHELRTPLNPVLLLASDAAENPTLPAEVRGIFETIRANVSLEARLIDDLLDLTRITRGKFNLDLRVVDVHEVFEEALAIVHADLAEKRLSLGIDFRAPRRRSRADPVRLQQVFWNVLKNAVKFTPPGGRIDVVTSLVPGDDDRLRIAITDNGLGLDREEVERVFEAFVQGRHHLGGLGLGLAISRMLIEHHGGTIRAESAGRGEGSTFTIELPMIAAAGIEEEPASPSAAQGARPSISREPGRNVPANRRILLVEDHAATRAALAHLLALRRFVVLSAASAGDAREIAREMPIDLIISDIGLPDGDGCELMAELRAAQPNLAGIALSGYGMEEDRARSHASGFGEHLTKPVNVRSLERAIARLLGPGPDEIS